MDIWYLPKDISKASGYSYILDVIDHFSKWLYSFPLKEKAAKEILSNFRKYILIKRYM